jgi:hypothetical protein
VDYTNDTGRAIMVSISTFVTNTSDRGINFSVNGTQIANCKGDAGGIGMYQRVCISAIIPAGHGYRADNGPIEEWAELR